MDRLIDPRGLLALTAVLGTGSLAAAAERLQWSQPTVDHHLRKLERTTGERLLERTPRGSTPTEAGRLVAERAREILALGERLLDDLAVRRRTGALPVRLGAFPTLGARILPEVHARLGDEGAPALEATLDEVSQLTASLERGELDLAIVFAMAEQRLEPPEGVSMLRLFAEPVRLCVHAAHPLERIERVADLGALRGERWAFGIDESDPLDLATRSLCRLAGFEPEPGMRTDDYPAVLRLVASGLVVAAVPRSALEQAPAGVRAVPVPTSLLRRDALLAVRRPDDPDGRHAAAIARVVDEVVLVARRLRPRVEGAARG
ncbi:MAG: LysR family transcriptional regulator [Microbacteriaceae bacterium]|nr:LysR family transcriptional regulator [Microbacteriaceae bacterium]